MNKRIFRSILSVSAAVLAAAMILVLGVLHQFVGDQLSRELKIKVQLIPVSGAGNCLALLGKHIHKDNNL